MKRALWVCGAILVVVLSSGSLIAAKYVPTIEAGTLAGPVPIGGLTREEAARRVRLWWEVERRQPLLLEVSGKPLKATFTPGQLGVTVDDLRTVAEAPVTELGEAATDLITRPDREPITVPILYKENKANLTPVLAAARETMGPPAEARAVWNQGRVIATPEVASFRVASDQVPAAVMAALAAGTSPIELPIEEAPKRVSDEVLASITDVVGSFATSFPVGQISRNSNIRRAASEFSGRILLPGERLSFNDWVGPRTLARGFREAGVYVSGRHDVGVGGGICQVSTTLYNAALLANLKIVRRTNHSMPVAYVPPGRDAAVSYGALDLGIENSLTTPIAIHAVYQPGRLTFRVLGQKEPGLEVKIVRENHKSWDRGIKTVVDPTLPAGKKVIQEKGSRGHSVETFRIVTRNGVVEKRERLGRSHYMGGVRIVAVGPSSVGETPGGSQ